MARRGIGPAQCKAWKAWSGSTARSIVTWARIGETKYPAINQTGLEVLPTRTIYSFEGSGIDLTLTFLTPALPQDLDLMSRPVTYLTWTAKSNDGKQHDVELYFDASTEIAANTADEPTAWGRYRAGNLDVLRAATQQQPILQKSGDNLRIDWGYLYVAAGQDPTGNPRGHITRADGTLV